jgi:hypothetical protein
MRAAVAQSTRSSKRSRSFPTASMMARISSGARPSGGCHCLVAADLTELRFGLDLKHHAKSGRQEHVWSEMGRHRSWRVNLTEGVFGQICAAGPIEVVVAAS